MTRLITSSALILAFMSSCASKSSDSTSSANAREQARTYARASVSCTTAADCCVVVDGCINQALVVGVADKDKVASLVAQPDPGGCTGCLLPAVQVTCDQGHCAGALVDVYSGDGGISSAQETQLTQSHCGSVAGVLGAKAATPMLRTQAIFGCGPM